MSDWQVGDLAVCVDDSPCECCGESVPGLAEGCAYTVTEARGFFDSGSGEDQLFLALAEIDSPQTENHLGGGWVDADCFRKIRPDEHEDCEPEFVGLLNRSKRRVSA